jgi:RNA polymerase sigma-70 factor, ECF subfamily
MERMMPGEKLSQIAALRAGDRKAFDQAYAAHHRAVYSFLVRLSRSPSVAEDLHQEVWIRLARKADTLADDTNLIAWLLTVARNVYRNHARWAFLDVSKVFAFGAVPEFPRKPETLYEAKQDARKLEETLSRMKEESREVLLLVAVSGLDSKEIAAILKITEDAVRQRISRARKELRDASVG